MFLVFSDGTINNFNFDVMPSGARIATQEEIDAYNSTQSIIANNNNIQAQIKAIEEQQARAIREMLVGSTDEIKTTAAAYVKQYDTQIIELRSQLQ